MEELFNIMDSDLVFEMADKVPSIEDMDAKEIRNKIKILTNLDCSLNQVVNILTTNPEYMDRTNGEIIKLIQRLLELGFDPLNILLDSNPFILNLEPFEIDNYISDRINKGENIEDIVDDLDSNTYLFNEM